jgi:hypothetical protein
VVRARLAREAAADALPVAGVVVTAAVVGITNREFDEATENNHMRRTRTNLDNWHRTALPGLLTIAVALIAFLPARSMAQQPGQKTFASAEEASSALVAASQKNDEKMILEILGKNGKRIVSSGDDVEDANGRANFVQKYEEMHRLVWEPDGTTILYIGALNWPTPIPLRSKGAAWYFDTEEGEKEILYRRIGRNEYSAIGVCQALVAAQNVYSNQHDEFAQRLWSDEGQHNGLYWKAAGALDGESPIGPLVASAAAEGYAKSQKASPTPYRGYYFQVLTRQGKGAPGGAMSYLSNGKMTKGFAFVAYPAEHNSSGVMTFIVNKDGIVYEKDLGKGGDAIARAMKEYDPGTGWQQAEEQEEEGSTDQCVK